MCAACTSEEISLGTGRARDAGVSETELAPFSEPLAIANLSVDGGKDDDPSLSADLTLLFFNSRREGGSGKEDIWFSSRSDAASEWSAPREVQELNTDQRETGLSLSADGLTLWFSSDRAGGAGGLDVYLARRARRADTFGTAEHVPELSSPADDLVSSITDDGLNAYLARRENEDDDYDMFVAERGAVGRPFGTPRALSSLNSDEEESDGFTYAAGLHMVLTRDEDLWWAQRETVNGAFTLGGPLAGLNSGEDDRDAWLSSDGKYVVFSSDRDGPYKLFEARR
jgi:hypothetical protein